MAVALGLYLAGVGLAVWRTDASWPLRTVLALLWPLGPAAFAVTVLLLLAASAIAFPLVSGLVAAGALAAWALLGG